MTNPNDENRYVLLLRTGAKKTAHHVLPLVTARSRLATGEQYDLWLEFPTIHEAKQACTDYNTKGRVIPPGNGA